MTLTLEEKEVIIALYERLEREEPNLSTEQLFASISEEASIVLEFAVDDGDISAALFAMEYT